jgi:hypothetical protein
MRRERMSELTHVGSKKVSRMPPRSAIVGFSVENLYAMAELLRRQKGGAAVVMGALSPGRATRRWSFTRTAMWMCWWRRTPSGWA